ncbi:hypothetical protein niasHT_023176 [Heterodera trifolii]|uniref:Uncharacterized protein n=1 Tax=Heterodera trifolii TaxID=157864 RepID=A0ABD2JD63_9BILA
MRGKRGPMAQFNLAKLDFGIAFGGHSPRHSPNLRSFGQLNSVQKSIKRRRVKISPAFYHSLMNSSPQRDSISEAREENYLWEAIATENFERTPQAEGKGRE